MNPWWQLATGIGSVLAGLHALRKARDGFGRADVHDVQTLDERIRYITRHIRRGRLDPEVKQLAIETVSKKCGAQWCVPEKDYEGEVRAIFAAVRERVRYVRDAYGVDQYVAARKTLRWGGGDCDDYVIILGSMLGAVGYPVMLRVIQTVDSPEWDHIYLLVGLPPGNPTSWVPLDASVSQPPGWEPPASMVVKYRDYEVR